MPPARTMRLRAARYVQSRTRSSSMAMLTRTIPDVVFPHGPIPDVGSRLVLVTADSCAFNWLEHANPVGPVTHEPRSLPVRPSKRNQAGQTTSEWADSAHPGPCLPGSFVVRPIRLVPWAEGSLAGLSRSSRPGPQPPAPGTSAGTGPRPPRSRGSRSASAGRTGRERRPRQARLTQESRSPAGAQPGRR